MECELAQQKIAFFAYGELPDDQCHALEGHLATCKQCQEEFAAVQALQQAMALAPAQEPSPSMLGRAPVAASVLLLLGLGGGGWGGYQYAARQKPQVALPAAIEGAGKIA